MIPEDHKIIPIDINDPHYVAELICLNCKHRAIHSWHYTSRLKELECPDCGEIGYLIQTGDILPGENSSLILE